ncbi:MAG: PQQ-like beta-propeller repeat protein [Ekhidna sp.]|nr:PQQ-like beta-propeller repeat protein [Ekhidna sp.]
MMKKRSKQAVICECFFMLLLFSGCKETFYKENPEIITDENGVVTSIPAIWEKDVSEGRYIWVYVAPMFHKDRVIVPGGLREEIVPGANEAGMLIALDVATGEEAWRWNDYVEGYDFEEISSKEQLNRKDNVVIYNENNRFCAVNLDNGTTLWKDKREGRSNSNSLQVVGEHYYFPFKIERDKNTEVTVNVLMRGSIHSPDHEQLIEVPIERIQLFGDFYGSFRVPHVYVENGSTKAFLAFNENLNLYKGQSLFGYISYDITAQTYDFEKVRLPDTAADDPGDDGDQCR